ncbi:MAG: carboxyl-terminal processing protease [Cryomorphaceae bacterium]|jgi:carboxyl-terminal processing protease
MNQNSNKNKLIIYYPLMLAFMLVFGIYLGTFFAEDGSRTFLPTRSSSNADKITQIISYIDREYVDTVAKNQMIEKAIASILEDLDPHSYYISAEEMASYTEPLEGNFEGIGVEFLIQNDTVRVVAALDGGPSQELGIQAGDKIINVDEENIAGVEIKNNDVISLLKGEGGTIVKVDILRNKKLIPFEITRGTIPINSVATAQIIDNTIGYIKISRFARTTYEEFSKSAEKLKEEGMNELVIDLRGNGGGYLTAAVQITEEFLQKGQLIVYTEGKSSPKKSYTASKRGKYSNIPLAILIDQGSASASEILAGAIQDNDRGVIVGRRSFGKGLVQEHMSLPDNSALRLTVARYYTPSGRSIQKPYGQDIDYEADYENRFATGELVSADSIHFSDSLQYVTPGGRIVYGGGGIMPDIFVGLDTAGASEYLSIVSYRGILNQFGFDYADTHRKDLANFEDYKEFERDFDVDKSMFDNFVSYAEEKGVTPDIGGINLSKEVLKLRIKAYIARNIWGNDGFYSIMTDDDKVIREALISISNTASL